MEGLTVSITVAVVLRLAVDATEYAVIGLDVEATALKLAVDAIE